MNTREMIIAKAKEMFRESGYTRFRMVELAEVLGISRGNLTYYFINKDALLETIWEEYEKEIFRWIDDSKLPYFNNMTRRIYRSLIFDINIFSDPACSKFYIEQLDSPAYVEFTARHIREKIDVLITTGIQSFNSFELSYLLDSLMGAYRAMDLKYARSKDNCDIYQFALTKQKIRMNMYTVIQPNLISDLEAAVEELKKRDFSSIKCI